MWQRRDSEGERLPALAPLIWAIGYSGLHATVLVRGVMAYQHPAHLGSIAFWSVTLALGAVFAAMMTAGWGEKPGAQGARNGNGAK